MQQVKAVVAMSKGAPVEVVTINVPDPGPGEAVPQEARGEAEGHGWLAGGPRRVGSSRVRRAGIRQRPSATLARPSLDCPATRSENRMGTSWIRKPARQAR